MKRRWYGALSLSCQTISRDQYYCGQVTVTSRWATSSVNEDWLGLGANDEWVAHSVRQLVIEMRPIEGKITYNVIYN